MVVATARLSMFRCLPERPARGCRPEHRDARTAPWSSAPTPARTRLPDRRPRRPAGRCPCQPGLVGPRRVRVGRASLEVRSGGVVAAASMLVATARLPMFDCLPGRSARGCRPEHRDARQRSGHRSSEGTVAPLAVCSPRTSLLPRCSTVLRPGRLALSSSLPSAFGEAPGLSKHAAAAFPLGGRGAAELAATVVVGRRSRSTMFPA